jgi:hypothetical protein
MSLKVLGLDLSITATGLTHTVEGAACSHVIKTREKDKDRRLIQLRNTVRELAPGATFALIEAPTARSFAAVIAGMVQATVRIELLELGIPYGTILPAGLKKYATGKGSHPGQGKTPMRMEAFKRLGLEFEDDNACDSWWAWAMACDFLGHPVLEMPKLNRESLSKIRMEG